MRKQQISLAHRGCAHSDLSPANASRLSKCDCERPFEGAWCPPHGPLPAHVLVAKPHTTNSAKGVCDEANPEARIDASAPFPPRARCNDAMVTERLRATDSSAITSVGVFGAGLLLGLLHRCC